MTQIRPRPVLIAAILSVVAAEFGCQRENGTAKQSAAQSRYVKPGPEESFLMIIETFRRGVEDVPIGFVQPNEAGHSMMTGRNEVSHELIRPAKEGDPYKAIITVGSQSRYSFLRSASDENDDKLSGENQTDSFAEQRGETGLQIFDRDLVSRSSDSGKESRSAPSTSENTKQSVMRQVDQQERTYELLYENGKWTLVTPLDPETEQSIQNAFNRALAMQI